LRSSESNAILLGINDGSLIAGGIIVVVVVVVLRGDDDPARIVFLLGVMVAPVIATGFDFACVTVQSMDDPAT
jgi:hypothetical protein